MLASASSRFLAAPARSMATLISGKEVASTLLNDLKSRVGYDSPGLHIIQVGERADSDVYIRNKVKKAKEIGFKVNHQWFPGETPQAVLQAHIDDMNNDPSVHGMIVQLPLETTYPVDTEAVIDTIHPDKDVDGLTSINAGKLARGELNKTVIPCTPKGVLELVKATGVDIEGKEVVVLGRSKIVGSPAAELFKWNHCTVTVCHSKTVNLKEMCQRADILIVAIGRSRFVKGDWIKPGAVVIDCGINVDPETGKLSGDVDTAAAKETAGYITPVPGGVGPMTIAMLLENTYLQFLKSDEKEGFDDDNYGLAASSA